MRRDASVLVRSPKGLSLRRIEEFIRTKRDWIMRTVERIRNTHVVIHTPFIAGKSLRYFGAEYTLDFTEEVFGGVRMQDNRIILSESNRHKAEEILRVWYRKIALESFVDRI